MRPLWKVGVRSWMGQFWELRSHTWLPPYITPTLNPKMAPFSNVTQCKDQVQFERLQFYLWKRSLTIRFLLGCDRNIDKGTVGDGALHILWVYSTSSSWILWVLYFQLLLCLKYCPGYGGVWCLPTYNKNKISTVSLWILSCLYFHLLCK